MSGRIVILVLGLVAMVVIGLIGWSIIRRKLFAHNIQERYALFLSTHAYQQLRHRYDGDLSMANPALDHHLNLIRGREKLDESPEDNPFFEVVTALPVRIELRDDEWLRNYIKEEQPFF